MGSDDCKKKKSFFRSVAAKNPVTEVAEFPSLEPSLSCVCSDCGASFPTNRALSCHQRVVHKKRSELKFYIAGSQCPVCLTTFSSRSVCLNHVSDARRPKCKIAILSASFPRLEDDYIASLDKKETLLRRQVARSGHSHIIFSAPAVSAKGRLLGVSSHGSMPR